MPRSPNDGVQPTHHHKDNQVVIMTRCIFIFLVAALGVRIKDAPSGMAIW